MSEHETREQARGNAMLDYWTDDVVYTRGRHGLRAAA